MTDAKDESKNLSRRPPGKLNLSSKLWRTVIVVFAVFLTFAGPTYIVYTLHRILKIENSLSMLLGFVLFIVGLTLIWYLIKNKIIS